MPYFTYQFETTIARVRKAWAALSAGQQRGFAHLVNSAKRPDTRAARVAQIELVLLGKADFPWKRRST